MWLIWEMWVNIPMGTYTLTQGTELLIDTSLTLDGAGSGDTIIQAAASSADATSRVLLITGDAAVGISEVTIRNGKASGGFPTDRGGGIWNQGTLAVTRIAVSGNLSSNGGGLFNQGSLTLTNSTIAGNVSESAAGGIENRGAANVTNSTISGNSGRGGRGGGIWNRRHDDPGQQHRQR